MLVYQRVNYLKPPSSDVQDFSPASSASIHETSLSHSFRRILLCYLSWGCERGGYRDFHQQPFAFQFALEITRYHILSHKTWKYIRLHRDIIVW